MDTSKRLHVNISALADGELPDSERELAMAALASDDGRTAWLAYHLIGDTLRAGADGALSDDFAARLAQRLAAEAPLDGASGAGSASTSASASTLASASAPASTSPPASASASASTAASGAPGDDGALPAVIASAS
ncbi:RseA family anti-sigma factor [Rugamonas apoptosis]|uniref:Transcriptional regulator n=1 Tax=Rugamonas apoptosis TaxID=2758570 RepID=A0A7W2IKB7_9BURK|nr:RseA family anti-sigma factor [Rugamonas apoptosis]MBA5687196.1 transcriptional regulator [Rugamonas apoptosis]